jgi:hypothetical protein
VFYVSYHSLPMSYLYLEDLCLANIIRHPSLVSLECMTYMREAGLFAACDRAH